MARLTAERIFEVGVRRVSVESGAGARNLRRTVPKMAPQHRLEIPRHVPSLNCHL
jgi:hypothetical protein